MRANHGADDVPITRTRSTRGVFRLLIPAVLILVATTGVVLIALLPEPKSDTAPPETPPVNVTVREVRALPELADTFDLTAVVEPNRVVRVAAEVAGRIEEIGLRSADTTWRGRVFSAGAPLQEGEPVTQGNPLILLNKDLLQARFERAQAQFDYEQREYLRIMDVFERGLSFTTELDDARTRRDVAKAELREAAEELEQATIAAPLDGILNDLPLEIGEYVSPGDCVAEIVDIERVKVVVEVPERDVHYLAVGQTISIFIRSPRTRELSGAITYISELADEATRTTRLEITVDNRERDLRSGQIVRARLTRRILTDVIMIPLGAVIPLEHGKAAYVVDSENRAQRREVELGFIKGSDVQILDGLAEGDRLIVAGHRFVGPGQPVNVVEEQ